MSPGGRGVRGQDRLDLEVHQAIQRMHRMSPPSVADPNIRALPVAVVVVHGGFKLDVPSLTLEGLGHHIPDAVMAILAGEVAILAALEVQDSLIPATPLAQVPSKNVSLEGSDVESGRHLMISEGPVPLGG